MSEISIPPCCPAKERESKQPPHSLCITGAATRPSVSEGLWWCFEINELGDARMGTFHSSFLRSRRHCPCFQSTLNACQARPLRRRPARRRPRLPLSRPSHGAGGGRWEQSDLLNKNLQNMKNVAISVCVCNFHCQLVRSKFE